MEQPSLIVAAVLTAAAFISQFAQGQTPPDNTGANKVESNDSHRTAQGQSNEPSDLEVTREIRRSVVADSSLSTYAHNVKIVTEAGRVTLNGVVRTDAEKAAVVSKAAQVAGASNVVDELKVAPAD
jgi:hyperosmotically inducible periplasmic protein